jgi:hypothetical protein
MRPFLIVSTSGVSEAVVVGLPFKGNEHSFTRRNNVDEVDTFRRRAVRPAMCEVCLPVYSIVERASKVEIITDQRLKRRTVFRDIGVVVGAGDRDCIVLSGHPKPAINRHLKTGN